MCVSINNVDASLSEMPSYGSEMADDIVVLRDERKSFEHKNRTVEWCGFQAKVDDISFNEIQLNACQCSTLPRGIKHLA